MNLIVVDAFTDKPFSGNPAAVAVLKEFPAGERMQAIAAEMNLSETAFVVKRPDGDHDLRWFTPTTEAKLCGHATLASAHALGGNANFHTLSGQLRCSTHGSWIEMDFPRIEPVERALPISPGFIGDPLWSGIAGEDWVVELQGADDVFGLEPDFACIASFGHRGLIVTASATGLDADFVSRFFAPNAGIDEDPVTGSAHCALAPYWEKRLGRRELVGYQASRRGGTVRMRLVDDRVALAGRAVSVSEVKLLV